MTQCEQIEKHLADGKSITPIQALNKFGCLRLASRIHEIKGASKLNIKKRMVTRNGSTFAEYSAETRGTS